MAASIRYTLVRSQLTGPAAHHDQLRQLLDAPADYWKAQTPLPFRPVGRTATTADGEAFAEFAIADGTTPGQVETLLVLLAARMPQLTLTLEVAGAGELVGLRLILGKLEAGRLGTDGTTTWSALPHHSTLIGSK